MYSIRPKWRLIPLLGAIAAMVALVLLFAGNPLTSQRAAAGAPPFNVSGIGCADSYLAELEQPIANPKPAGTTPGNAPSTDASFHVAITLSRTVHDTTSSTAVSVDPIQSVLQTYNVAIAGVIGGEIPITDFPLCAMYDASKLLATVVTNPTTPTDPQTLTVTGDGGNGPLPGMVVFWNSDNAAQRGFWVVTAASPGSVTLKKTGATCNQAPTSGFHAAPGALHSCIAENKGLNPYLFLPTDVTKNSLCCTPNLAPRPTQGTYNQATETSTTTICAVSTGKLEGGGQNAWTRTTITSVASTDGSKKTPSYSQTQLFNPTNPKTCTDIAGQTKRSTLMSVSWALDSILTGDGTDPNGWTSDYDKDGCTNAQELNSPAPVLIGSAGAYTGGRDPFNPNDCDRNFNSIMNLDVEAVPVTLVANAPAPGSFFHCRADMQDAANALVARVFCYVDAASPLYIAVNTAHSGFDTCPPGPASACGDGLTGGSYPVGTAPSPPPYGDVDAAHVVLTGSYNKTTDKMTLQGCYSGVENGILGPNVYVRTTNIDALSGHGTVDIWLGRTDCSDPGTATPSFDDVNIQMTELASKITNPDYDFDLDGCADKLELKDAQGQGGLRDPYNRYDYMNAEKDGQNRVSDILAVVGQYFLDDPVGFPDPNSNTDRTALIGGNDWNLGPPNGQQRVEDILSQVKQYFHDC